MTDPRQALILSFLSGNPLDLVDGRALGRRLRKNRWPHDPAAVTGPPIVIPGGRIPRAGRYAKGTGRPD